MTLDEPVAPPTEDAQPEAQASYRMKIGGMSCSFCTSTIRKAYERIDGVHDVGVSLAHEEGLVRYDPAKVTPDQLRRTLEQVGYTYRDPEKVRSFEDEEHELRVARNRLLVAGTLTVLALLMMLLGMWLQVARIPLMPWVALTLALETMFVTAWFVKKLAWASLRRGILNQHVLLEFAAFAGLVGGLLGIFVSPRFPAADFFAVSVFVTTYHLLSDYVSKVVRTRSSQAVRQLMALQPDTARLLRDGQEVEVPVDQVQSGDRVRIRPGESVPVDGQVVDGASAVDESLVTGEPIPTEKVRGDEVIGGSINQTGTLVVEVTRIGEKSFPAQVARSIEEARALRPGVLQLVDTVLAHFVPAVLLFAAASFLGWTLVPLLLGEGPNLFRATFTALAVLVLGYPCALGMSTPLAMIRGGGEAAEQGILMRSGEAFQVMGEIGSIAGQDRHADPRPPHGPGHRGPRRHERGRGPLGRGVGGVGQRAPAGPLDRECRRRAGVGGRAARRLRVPYGPRGGGHRRRRPPAGRQPCIPRPTGHRALRRHRAAHPAVRARADGRGCRT